MAVGKKNTQLQEALQKESQRFEQFYLWLEQHMPASFFEAVDAESIMLAAHALMGLDLQDYFAQIHRKHFAIVLCLDGPDADLFILKHYRMRGIKNYRTFISDAPPPFTGQKKNLRIAAIHFTEFADKPQTDEESLSKENQKELFQLVKKRNPDVLLGDFEVLLQQISSRFVRSLSKENLILALDMFYRAKTRDPCQYEVQKHEKWSKEKETPSMEIVLAWKNVPKHNFLYRLAKVIYRHGLALKSVNATYVTPYEKQNILILSIALHGMKGGAVWEEADLIDFLQELVTVKYFDEMETIETLFVDSGLVRGNLGNLIKTMVYFVHQTLVHADINGYSFANIEEGICRHPELTVKLCEAFETKFHPTKSNFSAYQKQKEELLKLVANLDTGHEMSDTRRKNVLRQAILFVDATLKTNFYRNNKTAFSFRIDPILLDDVPYDRQEKFPELPYAIFFMKGMHFFGFHIRFKDLSRGGLRTVFPQRLEQMQIERNNVFAECYGLAYTQQKKNKDIPEGGAKGIILLEPYDTMIAEEEIYRKELQEAKVSKTEIENRLQLFRKEHRWEFMYQAQRSYVESFLTLINCNPDGSLKAKHIVDYWKKPEYIYLGPDENMHDAMIEWISNYSKYYDYKPGGAFMSSKPSAGINHKEFGVTSLGVNVYMEEVLKFIGIDPQKESFTIKISGGPDGDVAGNQILNLVRFYPKTAKLLALTDVSGTIFDPAGLDLKVMETLFREVKPIRFYPPDKLSDGGFLLDLQNKREQSAYAQQTLCYRKKGAKVVEAWLSGNEMNHLFRNNVHQTKTDIFIPAGGRPRTLNETNYKEFLDATGKPTSRAIVEGANLYLTPGARRALENLGVIIIKDSSANKGGVICSSFEVLLGLTLSEEEFLKEKAALMPEVLNIIRLRAKDEAELMLRTHAQNQAFLTDISDWVSQRINTYKYELLDHLEPQTLSRDPKDPLIHCLLNYCPPLIRTKYRDRVLNEIPDIHKKAIISCYIAQRLVYRRGLEWSPSLADVLPLVLKDPTILGNPN